MITFKVLHRILTRIFCSCSSNLPPLQRHRLFTDMKWNVSCVEGENKLYTNNLEISVLLYQSRPKKSETIWLLEKTPTKYLKVILNIIK